MTIQKSKKKKLDTSLVIHRYAGYSFLLFFGLVLLAFWTSYYGKLNEAMETHVHLHGAAMTLWCLALISQAFLIRWKQFKLHRLIGKLSYLLVPFIIYSGFRIARITIRNMGSGEDAIYYYFSALMFNALVVFALFYGLAILWRKKATWHSRWMVCTIFPLITPATDRIIYKYADSLVALVPTLNGMPMVQVIGFILADLILILLVMMDWLRNRQFTVFPIALAIVGTYHISVVSFYRFSAWRAVTDWIMMLP